MGGERLRTDGDTHVTLCAILHSSFNSAEATTAVLLPLFVSFARLFVPLNNVRADTLIRPYTAPTTRKQKEMQAFLLCFARLFVPLQGITS
jgi:hypothetical protein